MDIHDKTILITGGAGAIGGALCRALLQAGCRQIIVIDDLSSGIRENIPVGVEFLEGSITDEAVLTQAFAQSIDVVFHLAAHFANQNSIDHPEADLSVNGLGTLKLLEKARTHGVKKFIYASSSCVYGPQTEPIVESMAPGALETPYAVSKWMGEEYASLYHRLYNLPIVILRYFNSFGPGERPGKYRNVIPNFIAKALAGESLVITGTGEETRDFTYVDNTVRGTIQAAEADQAVGRVYNIGSGRDTSIRDLAERINRLTGNQALIVYEPRRTWDHITRRVADISAAARDFGYAPENNLDAQLQTTIDWLKEKQKKGDTKNDPTGRL